MDTVPNGAVSMDAGVKTNVSMAVAGRRPRTLPVCCATLASMDIDVQEAVRVTGNEIRCPAS